MLELKECDAYYGPLQALWNVSFGVPDDKIVALIGPNGHGKTTILRMISGLVPTAKGSISFDGTRIDNLPPYKVIELGITHVQEGSRLFNQMTVLENLKLGAYTSRAWRKRKENLENVYRIFPVLKDRKNQTVWTLSGGERRMCAIGKGLMSEPKLLMLDEPSLGLAPIVCKQLFEHILRIRETGVNILLIEQKTTYVSEVANDVCLVNKGRVVLSGPVDEVLKHDYVKEAYFGTGKQNQGTPAS